MNNIQKAEEIILHAIDLKQMATDHFSKKYGCSIKVKMTIKGIPFHPHLKQNEILQIQNKEFLLGNDGIQSHYPNPLDDDLYLRFQH